MNYELVISLIFAGAGVLTWLAKVAFDLGKIRQALEGRLLSMEARTIANSRRISRLESRVFPGRASR